VKEWNPKILTVVGGHHATIRPDDFLSSSIDLIVRGEGVFAFKEIINRHRNGKGYDGISGVGIVSKGCLDKIEVQVIEDLDSIPFPNRKITNIYRNKYYTEYIKSLAMIRTSKGCPYRCKFCNQWKVTNGKYLKREPEKIVEELKTIDEQYVFFADDESLIDAKRMHQLASLIKAAGIKKKYLLYGRSDTIIKYPELIDAWKEIGLERMYIGVESFQKNELEFVKKELNAEDNEKAICMLRERGIDVHASLMIRQDFTKKEFALVSAYCKKMKLINPIFPIFTPHPYTEFYNEFKEQLITQNYAMYDLTHTVLPTKLPRKEFYRYYRYLYTRGNAMKNIITILKKYEKKDIVPFIMKAMKYFNRLKNIHCDYIGVGAE
jgi:radical SAM superfamily enzyme YgiQ (UPF0313 family)